MSDDSHARLLSCHTDTNLTFDNAILVQSNLGAQGGRVLGGGGGAQAPTAAPAGDSRESQLKRELDEAREAMNKVTQEADRLRSELSSRQASPAPRAAPNFAPAATAAAAAPPPPSRGTGRSSSTALCCRRCC